MKANDSKGTLIDPEGNFLAEVSFAGAKMYSNEDGVTMNDGSIDNAGGGQAHNNMQPF